MTFLRKNEFKSERPVKPFPQMKDLDYLSFLKNSGDGFYFNNSLHLYGSSLMYDYHDLVYRNNLMHRHYSDFIDQDVICFGEDLFGNQFVFYDKGIGLLSIEIGDIEFIAQNFSGWLAKLAESVDYYSGESLIMEWKKNHQISSEERLTPKVPFVLGGLYQVENLYKAKFNLVLDFNADLVKQIRDLPDGAAITLKIID